MSWKKAKLSECCQSISDGDHQAPPKSNKGIPFVTISNIKDNSFDFTNCMHVPQSYYDNLLAKRKPQKGDILYSVVGSFGIPVLIKENVKFTFQRHIAILRPNPHIVEPAYMYYSMLSKAFFLQADAAAIGAAQRTISLSSLQNLTINLPDLPTQRRIASILSAYDDLIENNRRQIKLLEEAAQRLYREWFVELRFPGHESVKVVDGVPEGWKIETVGSLLRKIPRTKQVLTSDYQVSGNIPIVDQSRDFIAGYTNDTDACVKPQDAIIVFGDHTRILKYITFPFAKGADGTQLIVSNSDCMPQSLFYFSIIHIDLTNYHYARHFKYLKESTILVPTKSIANAYDNIVHPIMKRIQVLRDSCVKAKEARDRLLPILMNREMEVSE